jgi:hypothetical protein
MVKRYSVSVSDELGEKINRWEISPSEVFQKAMESVISEKEKFINRLRGDETMDQIIERLRAEMVKIDGIFYTNGKNTGLEWAKVADYGTLRYAAELFEPINNQENYVSDAICRDQFLGGYFSECFVDNSEFATGENKKIYPNLATWRNSVLAPLKENGSLSPAGEQWVLGWCDGVRMFWKEISSKLGVEPSSGWGMWRSSNKRRRRAGQR